MFSPPNTIALVINVQIPIIGSIQFQDGVFEGGSEESSGKTEYTGGLPSTWRSLEIYTCYMALILVERRETHRYY